MPAQDNSETATATNDGHAARSTNERPSDERYDAQRIEAKWFERWQQDASLYASDPSL